MSLHHNISATILTFNEEEHIGACIDSLDGIAEEIIVVDSGSTDNTVDICRSKGCRVVTRPMKGYGAQRQYATSLAGHTYVLSIDADEELSPAAIASLLRLKEEGFAHRGYSFTRLNFYCGQPVRHCGWYPDIQVRLFDRRYANWNLRGVDERVIFRDNISPEPVDGDIFHYRCSTTAELDITEERHARLEADRLRESGRRIGWLTPYIEGAKAYAKCFLSQGGWMDGIVGRAISRRRFLTVFHSYSLARQ
ncbi:MAG: glycosyltransferase family 2 protein [Pseudoflavonifractor sp.]|nr:glycosyltransferase family 2 protein [Alloprevotella sp.]MCM1116940.1 glycosyltransferase family 2 protein [Pseudoflavonifractor sp.]